MELLAGRYELGPRLGAGGMGEVHAARDVVAGRDVVIKRLTAEARLDLPTLARFVREARLAARVRHPNVIETTDLVTEGPHAPFIVLERLTGETLEERLARGPASGVEAARVGVALLDALAAVHAEGIVHRDVKPSNVFLCAGSSPPGIKLIDFGVARAEDDASLTATGALVGTPAYMSPEQVGGGTIDARTDVYAVGATLYEALSGRPPFEVGGARLLKAVVLDELGSLAELRPDLDAALVRIVHTALAKNPELRYSAASEMRARLAEWLGVVEASETAAALGAGAPSRAPGRERSGAPRPRPRRPRSRAAPLLVGALFLALALGAAIAWVTARARAPIASSPHDGPVVATSVEPPAPAGSPPSPSGEAPSATASAAPASPRAPSARERARALHVVSVFVEAGASTDAEATRLRSEVTAYAERHFVEGSACGALVPPTCIAPHTIHLGGPDAHSTGYILDSEKSCYPLQYRSCVARTTSQRPLALSTSARDWHAEVTVGR